MTVKVYVVKWPLFWIKSRDVRFVHEFVLTVIIATEFDFILQLSKIDKCFRIKSVTLPWKTEHCIDFLEIFHSISDILLK